MLAFRQAGLRAGGRHRCIRFLGMAQRRNSLLLQQNFAAYRAVLAFRQTSLRAGGSHCCIRFLGMAQRRNSLLRQQNFATYRAMLTFRQAGFRTGGSHRCILFLGVAQRRNNLLRQQDFITNRANHALRQAGLCTGGSNRRQRHTLMIDTLTLHGALRLGAAGCRQGNHRLRVIQQLHHTKAVHCSNRHIAAFKRQHICRRAAVRRIQRIRQLLRFAAYKIRLRRHVNIYDIAHTEQLHGIILFRSPFFSISFRIAADFYIQAGKPAFVQRFKRIRNHNAAQRRASGKSTVFHGLQASRQAHAD